MKNFFPFCFKQEKARKKNRVGYAKPLAINSYLTSRRLYEKHTFLLKMYGNGNPVCLVKAFI
jgi:hypothetical protein